MRNAASSKAPPTAPTPAPTSRSGRTVCSTPSPGKAVITATIPIARQTLPVIARTRRAECTRLCLRLSRDDFASVPPGAGASCFRSAPGTPGTPAPPDRQDSAPGIPDNGATSRPRKSRLTSQCSLCTATLSTVGTIAPRLVPSGPSRSLRKGRTHYREGLDPSVSRLARWTPASPEPSRRVGAPPRRPPLVRSSNVSGVRRCARYPAQCGSARLDASVLLLVRTVRLQRGSTDARKSR